MADPRRIQMCLFLIVMLQITAASDEHKTSYVFVRVGHEVTLPCAIEKGDQGKCSNIIWNLSVSIYTASVKLFGPDTVGEKAKSKSDRLSVTGNCSLVIKNIKVEDVGLYGCKESSQVALFHLSVVTMTEHKDNNKVTLNCSVWTREHCSRHTVKWLYEGKDVDENNKDLNTSQSSCYKTVSFMDSHSFYTSQKNELLHCEITDTLTKKVQEFPFRSQFLATRTTESPVKSATAAVEFSDASTNLQVWWWLIIVAVGVAGLIITAVVVQRHKRRKGKKTQISGNNGLSLNLAEPQSGPETRQDTTDPEEGVSYASISFIKKTNSKVQVQNQGEEDDDDEGDAVTYSSVNPRSLYSTINTLN